MANFREVSLIDFSGGMNKRNSGDGINDNEFQFMQNMSGEGNKLVLMKGFISEGLIGDFGNIMSEEGDSITDEGGNNLITDSNVTFV